MKPRAQDLDRVAMAVVRALAGHDYAHRHKDETTVARRIAAVIEASFEKEAELEREAKRMARIHAGKMSGMDQRKIIQGIMARLAAERNFPL